MTEKNEYSCTIPGTFVLDCSIQRSDCSVHHLEWVVFIWLFLRLDRLFRSHQGLTLNDSLKLLFFRICFVFAFSRILFLR